VEYAVQFTRLSSDPCPHCGGKLEWKASVVASKKGEKFTFSSAKAATTFIRSKLGHQAGGAGSRECAYRPELDTRPLCLRRKASPFWIMLLLVWAHPEHLEPVTLVPEKESKYP
jgi:hypothetical protein